MISIDDISYEIWNFRFFKTRINCPFLSKDSLVNDIWYGKCGISNQLITDWTFSEKQISDICAEIRLDQVMLRWLNENPKMLDGISESILEKCSFFFNKKYHQTEMSIDMFVCLFGNIDLVLYYFNAGFDFNNLYKQRITIDFNPEKLKIGFIKWCRQEKIQSPFIELFDQVLAIKKNIYKEYKIYIQKNYFKMNSFLKFIFLIKNRQKIFPKVVFKMCIIYQLIKLYNI